MKTNPDAALAALLPEPIPIPGIEEAVRPISLAAYALLERSRSPFVMAAEDDPEDPNTDNIRVIESLFILTHNPREISYLPYPAEFRAEAMAWADTVPVRALLALKDAALRQLSAALAVVPPPGKDQKKMP